MERAGAYTAHMPKPARAPRPVAPPAPEPNEIASLTGLRGLAAVGVLGLHAIQFAGYPAGVPAPLAWLLKMGWAGVDVFFVLSAFLLSLPFARADRQQRRRGREVIDKGLRRVKQRKLAPVHAIAVMPQGSLVGQRISYFACGDRPDIPEK